MGIQISFIDSYQFLNDSLSNAVNTQMTKENWKEMGCHSMLDYMLVCMKLDVFLLADVFQQFRQKSI